MAVTGLSSGCCSARGSAPHAWVTPTTAAARPHRPSRQRAPISMTCANTSGCPRVSGSVRVSRRKQCASDLPDRVHVRQPGELATRRRIGRGQVLQQTGHMLRSALAIGVVRVVGTGVTTGFGADLAHDGVDPLGLHPRGDAHLGAVLSDSLGDRIAPTLGTAAAVTALNDAALIEHTR